MRIYSLRKDEKKAYVSILPEGIDIENSLILVAADETDPGTPVVGILVFSTVTADTWHMDYIMVTENYRRKGVARALVSYGSFMIRMMGASMISADILYGDDKDEAQALKKCLSSLGFASASEKEVYVISSMNAVDRLEPYMGRVKRDRIVSLKKISNDMWDEMRSYFYSMLDDKEFVVPIHDKKYYNTDLSMVMQDDYGMCIGLLLISDIDEDLSVDYIWSGKGNGFITMALLIASISALKNDCDILFHAHTKGAKKVVDTLFGNDKTLKYKASKMTMDLEF